MIRGVSMFTLAMSLVLSSAICYGAIDIDTRGLTEAQKATLVQQAEQMKEQAGKAAQTSQLSAEKVNEWAELGKNIAITFTTVAKELGVAADQFLNSTTGKITLFLIVWKMAGRDILGLMIGTSFLLAFVPLWIYFFRRLCLMKSVITEPVEGHRRLKRTVEYLTEDHISNKIIATRWVMLVVLILIVFCGLTIAL